MASSSSSAKINSAAEAGLITIGRVIAPHGLKGEVRVRLETDFPDRYRHLRQAFVVMGGGVEPVIISRARPHRGGVLLTLEGVTDPAGAERLRGAEIAVRREATVPLGVGQYYVFQIIGLKARTVDGRGLGTVTAVIRAPANDVYVVQGDGGEVLIPALRQVVRSIDLDAGVMIVAPPPGLEAAGHAG